MGDFIDESNNFVIKMHLALAPTSRVYKLQSSPMLQLVGWGGGGGEGEGYKHY